MGKPFPSYDEVQQVREKLRDMAHQHWLHDDFLTWKWWLLLFFSIVPWLIWYKIVDKKRFNEILLFGLIIAILSILIDNIGTELLWWGYPDKLFQMIPPLFPADISLVPCLMMLVYQWSRSWKSFLLINFMMSLFMTYIGESLFIWLDYYRLNEWNSFFSLLFYNISGVIGRYIVSRHKNQY